MNPTEKLLETLANKLGTTTEYLWGILLKQAPIYATVSLIQVLVIWGFGIVLYIIHGHLSNDENEHSYYNQDLYSIVMCIVFIMWIILSLLSLFELYNIVNGYFNPEYWALKEILDTLKN